MSPPSAMSAARPPTIGIVGGIGSGKSAVARILASLGCEVCVSDDLARAVLGLPEVRREIAAIAPGAACADGSIDRAALGRAIFSDAALRRAVESIMHPRIEAVRRAQFAAAPPATRAFVIDAPLLLEVGLDRECDAVLFVDAPREQRLARVSATRGWDAAELDRRESAQISLEEKRRRATDIVLNDGEESMLRGEVARVLDRILGRIGASRSAPPT